MLSFIMMSEAKVFQQEGSWHMSFSAWAWSSATSMAGAAVGGGSGHKNTSVWNAGNSALAFGSIVNELSEGQHVRISLEHSRACSCDAVWSWASYSVCVCVCVSCAWQVFRAVEHGPIMPGERSPLRH